MSDFFKYGSKGKEIDINQFKKELEKSGAKESDVKRFFNFFDADGNGKIENTEQHKELDKLTVFYNELKQAANTDGNDFLNDTELANMFKNENTEIAKEMSKDTTLVSSIKSFLTSLNKTEDKKEKKDNTKTTPAHAIVPTELSAEEIAVDKILGDVTTAKEIYNTQRSTQGDVSNAVDEWKEFWDTEFAASKIERYINDEELSLSLLNQAKDGTLTKKSYYEQKISYLENILAKAKDSEDLNINTLAEMLSSAGSSALKTLGINVDESKPKSADEIALDLLKAALNNLKPEQIDVLLSGTSDTSQLGNVLNDVVSGYLSNFNISVDTVTVNEPKIIGYIDEFTGKIYDSEDKVPSHKSPEGPLIKRATPKYSETETKSKTITNVKITQTTPIDKKGTVGEIIHSELNELMTFEEAFKAERGVEYNEENIRDYQLKDAQSKFLLAAYNKKQEVYNTLHQKTVAVRGENEHGETYQGTHQIVENQLSAAIVQTLTELYGSVENGLEKLGITGVKLQEVEENGLKTTKLVQDFGEQKGKIKFKEQELDGLTLVNISDKIQQTLDSNFEKMLGGKSLEYYINETSDAYKKAYGTKNATTLAEGYKQNQEEIVANLRGGLQNVGMAATIVGGILLMTPAAPLGGTLVSVGSKAAMTGMVVNHALGFTEALTRDEINEDEIKELLKDAVVDAAGFIIGMKAGKLADKRFAKLIDAKLAETLKQNITAGNRAEALKMIFTNPDNLKNFATAAGAKFGTDFLISLAGDLALAGLLDTGEDVQQLIRANLMGLIISTSNDLKTATLSTKTHGDCRSVAENPSDINTALPKVLTIAGASTIKDTSRSGNVDYSKLPTYTQTNRPENTTVMPSEGLIISRENGQVVGRLGTDTETPVVMSLDENEGVKTKPTSTDAPNGTEENSLLTRLETANDRETFVAIRDEIKKMPNGEEKTQLMQAYLKKYNEWSADPSRPDIRMEYNPIVPERSTLTDLMKDILGDINDTEPISEQTATELHSLLDNLNTVMKPEKVDEFLSLIPNEHCAKVLSRYFDKFKDNDWQTAYYYQLIYDMKNPENVKELVRVIESPEINEDIKTPKNLSYTTFSGKPNQFSIAASYDVFKKITDTGLGARGNSEVINFKEIDFIMNKITDPQKRAFVAKLYTSKLFSRVDFYTLLQMDRETDLTNLSKIEDMMDAYSTLEKMEMHDINHLLKAPDKLLDIISQRNLLKNIPNRKYKFTGNEAIRLAEVDDATWQIILDRKLLEDVPERSDILRPALSTGEIKTYAKLSDAEWAKLKSRKLLVYPENINEDLKELYTSSDFISKIARLSDSDYAKIEQLVKYPNNNVKLLETVIKETESGAYLDETILNYGIKLAEILESSETDVQRMLTGLNNQDGTFNTECADKLYDFILELKNDNFSMKYVQHALSENVRTKHISGVVTLSWNDLQKRPPFSVGEIDAKSRIYKSMKEFNRYELSEFDRAEILKQVNEKSEKFIDQLLHDESLGYSPKSKILNIFGISQDSMGFLAEQDINAARESALYQRQKALEAPDRYVNGEYDSVEDMQAAVNKFFDKQDGKIMLMASIYDKEALNNLLRMRFDDAEEYFDIIHNFEKPELELLQKMSASCNIDGKPFMPTQKIELMDLIQAYHENELPFDKMYSMLEEDNIDIGQLNIDLFNKIMKNSGLTDEEIASIPKERLTAWDTKFAHLLSKEINSGRDVAFSDVLRAGNLSPNFIQYIHNTENIYGQTNANTRSMYEQMGMDYEHWLKPSKENEIHFLSKDKNAEQLSQIGNQLLEDIETLRATPVKGFLDKQFPKCIKDGKFLIPTEVLTSKAKLNEFTTNLIKQLDSVWKRAQGNLENPQRAANARNTLTILDHFNQRLDDISKVQDGGKATKTLDLTIKMWDRIPQKDIFQGNYSTCCIAMGGGNGSAMPHFVMNTAYNMIELVDNQTGKTIGNALCYFIKGEDGKPAFIIDNIEINNGVKPSAEIGIQLRNSMAEYAAKVSKEVTGSDDTHIYMSSAYNDVPYSDLSEKSEQITFLGDIDCDEIYMDLYGGWVYKDEFTSKQKLFILK